MGLKDHIDKMEVVWVNRREFIKLKIVFPWTEDLSFRQIKL